jgi:hypothetical protein
VCTETSMQDKPLGQNGSHGHRRYYRSLTACMTCRLRADECGVAVYVRIGATRTEVAPTTVHATYNAFKPREQYA